MLMSIFGGRVHHFYEALNRSNFWTDHSLSLSGVSGGFILL